MITPASITSPTPVAPSGNLLQRAAAGVNLTPGERAILRVLIMAALAGLVTAIPIVTGALSSTGAVDWRTVAVTAASAFGVAALEVIRKYASALRDAWIGQMPPA